MHLGLVAVKADVTQLAEAFPLTWPRYEVKAAASLDGMEELWRWHEANEQSDPAKRWSKDVEVFDFWEDGPWAIMMDPSFVQVADEGALAALSSRFGIALSFVIETAAGCAYFWCFKQGRLLRSIQYVDGELVTRGERMEEESGMPETFYMDETEELQRRFGITPLAHLSETRRCEALAVVDRTHDGALPATRALTTPSPFGHLPPPSGSKSNRPWWRFW